MRIISLLLVFIGLVMVTCIDPLDISIPLPATFPLAIDGYISDNPGPYEVRLNLSFDVQSSLVFKSTFSAQRVTMFDNVGNSEVLTQVAPGVYRTGTKANSMRGILGRAYHIKVELLDGRVYESVPDTLQRPGKVDSVYYTYHTTVTEDGRMQQGLDILFDSSPEQGSNFRFMWKFRGTFQIETNPELYDTICADGRCPKPLQCSGWRLDDSSRMRKVRSCTCCQCWATMVNPDLVLSENQFVNGGRFKGIKVGYMPVDEFTFMHKVHAEVQQLSLSDRAFRFWKAVNDQRKGTGSLFQPITGKVQGNFVQTAGNPAAIEGLFYAASISKHALFIDRLDLEKYVILTQPDLPYKNSCLKKYGNSSTTKPEYWVD